MSESAARPSIEESALAVVKALHARRDRHAPHDANRVSAITLPPRAGRDGWWLVGRICDELEGAEFSVWYMPGSRRIGLSTRNAVGGRSNGR